MFEKYHAEEERRRKDMTDRRHTSSINTKHSSTSGNLTHLSPG